LSAGLFYPAESEHFYTASDNLRYILHTEPSFAHPDSNGIKGPAADLRWRLLVYVEEGIGCNEGRKTGLTRALSDVVLEVIGEDPPIC